MDLLAVAFLAVVFFAITFFALVFLAVTFLATGFLAIVFLAVVLAVIFLGFVLLRVFLAVIFRAVDFFALTFLAVVFLVVVFLAVVLFAGTVRLLALTVASKDYSLGTPRRNLLTRGIHFYVVHRRGVYVLAGTPFSRTGKPGSGSRRRRAHSAQSPECGEGGVRTKLLASMWNRASATRVREVV